ncbi:MAG: saccharopine dehydrogenase C-terminal domain-containing protein [Desulfurococcaceae archaeon]
MGYKALLLGVGKQGKAALWDLLKSNIIGEVTAVDISDDAERYEKGLGVDKATFIKLDFKETEKISELIKKADIVVDLSPPQFTFTFIKLAIENGKHIVSTMYALDPSAITDPPRYSALREEVRRLDEIAKKRQVTALPEFGLDPGIDLVLTGQAIKELDEVYELYTYGAGIPDPQAASTNPLKYKVTWHFEGVLRAYVRPARIIHEGKVKLVPGDQIFSPEYCREEKVEELGILESYPNGDAAEYAERFELLGKLKFAGRYSMRWPGHCDFWKKLVDLHFLDEEPIRVDSASVSPRKFLAALLEPQLQLKEGERDIALVRVDARGVKGGKYARVVYQLLDYRDLETGFTAMQRTTGFTASVGAQMILRGDISKRGILFPGTDVPLSALQGELEKRGIKIKRLEIVEK